MTVFEQVGQGVAQADLAVAKAIGVLVGFTHRATLPFPIHCQLVSETSGNAEPHKGRLTQWTDLKLVVPVQPAAFSGASGYSGAGAITRDLDTSQQSIIGGDRIEYPLGSQRYFYVVPEEMRKIHNGYSYLILAKNEKSLTLGVKS